MNYFERLKRLPNEEQAWKIGIYVHVADDGITKSKQLKCIFAL